MKFLIPFLMSLPTPAFINFNIDLNDLFKRAAERKVQPARRPERSKLSSARRASSYKAGAGRISQALVLEGKGGWTNQYCSDGAAGCGEVDLD